uniref:Protein kinase domain-containing protein n=1 Tax=Seriola dumerili TaxID=41447 RepID=A0A3B4TG50_SERDU
HLSFNSENRISFLGVKVLYQETLEHFEYKGHVCLAFEMLDINIYDFIRSRDFQPLHLSEIRVITQQMLVALNALKSVGLSHADVKPDNIMLVNHQQPFRVKLIGYRAPEVMLGFPLDEAVDMWSLGCVLAFMYLGQNLYPIRCAYQVMRAIVQICFFSKDKDSSNPSWRLNTEAEYMLLTGSKTRRYRGIFDELTSLNDVTKTRPEVNDTTESEDTQAFLSLLKRMLQVDPQKRITLSEALGHRFITMKHFPHDANPNPLMSAAFSTITKCQLEESSVKFKHSVTSSEVVSFKGESIFRRSLDSFEALRANKISISLWWTSARVVICEERRSDLLDEIKNNSHPHSAS